MKRILKATIPTVLTMSLLASCGGADEPTAGNEPADAVENTGTTGDNTQLVGVVLPTKDEPRWLQDEARFKEVLESQGYNVEISFSQGSSATEKQNVETLITKGADVIIICAQDGAAAGAAVQEAKKAGIDVIAYDRLITETDAVDYYVTFDSVSVGKAQANYLIDQAAGKTGVPLYLYAGAASDNNAFLFFQGAWETLQPKIADGTFVIANSEEAMKLQDKVELTREEQAKIIGQITTNWDANEAKKKAEAHLTNAKSDAKGEVFILAPNDGTARSIADVFAMDPDVSNYFITGQDAEKPSVQYIIDGRQSMTVLKDVRILANDAIEMAVDLLNDETPETTATYNNGAIDVPSKQTDVIVVDQNNVKAELIDSGYYSAGDFTGLN